LLFFDLFVVITTFVGETSGRRQSQHVVAQRALQLITRDGPTCFATDTRGGLTYFATDNMWWPDVLCN
jgi:hypothetical protein